jgi:hypothetical protein
MVRLVDFFSVTGTVNSRRKARVRTSAMTGCSLRTLDRFKEQETQRESLSPLKKNRCGRRDLSMPQWTHSAIRTVITRMPI